MKSTLLVLVALASAQANVKLPAVLSDRMVVQQGAPVRIWGSADPGEAVTVSFHGRKAAAKADSAGKWKLSLKPVKPGGPYEMTVSGQNTIVLKDVLVGEVWIGSGQSNMVLSVARSKDPEQEIAAANFPRIRLFKVKLAVAEAPAEDVEGSWQICTPETVRDFSAIGYFFSRDIQQDRHVPVGFIQSAWGGTPAEAWTSRRAMDAQPALKSVFDDWGKTLAAYPDAKVKYDKQVETWEAAGKKDPAPRPPVGPGHQYTPGGLYNAMIAPLTPLSMRGVLWYQGENNARKGRDYLYRTLMKTLIEDWRGVWGEGDFPFLFVQLPNYNKGEEGAWPVLRESQVTGSRFEGDQAWRSRSTWVNRTTSIRRTSRRSRGVWLCWRGRLPTKRSSSTPARCSADSRWRDQRHAYLSITPAPVWPRGMAQRSLASRSPAPMAASSRPARRSKAPPLSSRAPK